jgi:acetyl esterase/lipase
VLDVDISTTGMIAGHISPPSTPVVVTVSGGGHVYSTVEDRNGYFKIKGLAAGTYSVTITPNLPLLPITIPNVSVSVGATSDLGLVAF